MTPITVRNLSAMPVRIGTGDAAVRGGMLSDKRPVIGQNIALAATSLSRLVGLLGKTYLQAGFGVLLRPSSGVHTVGMQFAIDVVGLDAQLRVVRLWPELAPFRVTPVSLKISSVLELAAGQIAACNLELGDQLAVESTAPEG